MAKTCSNGVAREMIRALRLPVPFMFYNFGCKFMDADDKIEEHEKVVENVMAQRGTSVSDVTMEGEDSFAENLQALAEIRRSQKELADLALKAVHLSRAVLKVLPASTT